MHDSQCGFLFYLELVIISCSDSAANRVAAGNMLLNTPLIWEMRRNRHTLAHTCDIPTRTKPHSWLANDRMVLWYELIPDWLEDHLAQGIAWKLNSLPLIKWISTNLDRVKYLTATTTDATGNFTSHEFWMTRMETSTKVLATLSIFFVFLKVSLFKF